MTYTITILVESIGEFADIHDEYVDAQTIIDIPTRQAALDAADAAAGCIAQSLRSPRNVTPS